MHVRVLGAAAGGGFPQWNCNCPGCARARSGDCAVRPRTQASLAVSADGVRWVLLNASPDLPYQIASAPCLQPKPGDPLRHSPICAVIISGGDVDCIAGLLSMREAQKFALYADGFVQKLFYENRIFRVLDRRFVTFNALPPGQVVDVRGADGAALRLTVEAFPVPGKVPLYEENSDDIAALHAAGAVVGLCISDGASRIFYIPGCAAVTPELRARLRPDDVLFFDGTLWRDDEMIAAGTGVKTGARMGHISVSGAQGSIAAFADAAIARKIFIHINNTNPMLCDDSAQAAFVRQAGWEIAYDGMELTC
jgi:pyrroloquinoline quinone biosynthesis protein B